MSKQSERHQIIVINSFALFEVSLNYTLVNNRECVFQEFSSLNKLHENLYLGILPPRSQIHELNHPISPPVKYYSNFGQSLRGDKFEGMRQLRTCKISHTKCHY